MSEDLTRPNPKTIWEWARIVTEDERPYIGKRRGAELFGKWLYTDGNRIVEGATLEEMVAQLRARFGVGFYGLIEWPLTYTNWASLKVISPIAYWVVEISDIQAPQSHRIELDLAPLAEECCNNWAKMRDCLMRYLAYSFLESEQVGEENITKQPFIPKKKKLGRRPYPTTLHCVQLVRQGGTLEQAALATEEHFWSDVHEQQNAKLSESERARLRKSRFTKIMQAAERFLRREKTKEAR